MQSETSFPKSITVCILTWNEEENIARCLESLVLNCDALFPGFDVMILDNGSTDRTRDEVNAIAKAHPALSIRWIDTGRNHLGLARRKAMELAVSDWVAFLDADCQAPVGWLSVLGRELLKAQASGQPVLGVGSGNIPPRSDRLVHQGLRHVLSHFLGHFGSMQARRFRTPRFVNHLPTCNILFDRAKALEAGNFSTEFDEVCEDLEFTVRARKKGLRLIYVPGADVIHYHRPEFLGWAEKMFRYGRGQIRVAKRHPLHLAGSKALPLLFGLFVIGLFAYSLALGAFFIVSYFLFFGVFSAWLCRQEEDGSLILAVATLFTMTHFCYAAGEVFEIVSSVFSGMRRLTRLPEKVPADMKVQ